MLDANSKVANNGEYIYKFTCIAKSLKIWHARLGHLNVAFVKWLRQMYIISNYLILEWNKCQVCPKAKDPKKPFHKTSERQTDLVELTHNDLEDLKNTMI